MITATNTGMMRQLASIQIRQFGLGRSSAAKGSTWEQFKQSQGQFGKDSTSGYRAQYEKEKKDRFDTKLNWGIKNRWEQRALDEVLKNRDVRKVQFRNMDKI